MQFRPSILLIFFTDYLYFNHAISIVAITSTGKGT
jgi:hypothetical protein